MINSPDGVPVREGAVARRQTGIWPRYDAAVLGLRNYWYPTMWSRELGPKPRSVTVLGEPVMFVRENGVPRALFDQCPHRGIPLSVGRQEFPGTWTCRYHGWTFDLETGILRAALTDGPDSPICGKVRVKTYPVAERGGLVFVYMGEGPPPPVEEDVPDDFLYPDAVLVGRVTVQKGNWRYAVENSFDSGHANYLHRYGAIHSMFRKMPAWSHPTLFQDEDRWLSLVRKTSGQEAEYPGLGRYPHNPPWRVLRRKNKLSLRLPGVVRLRYDGYPHTPYVWPTPVDQDHYRLFQFYATRAHGLAAAKFRAYYYSYIRWAHHIQFNNQDAWMVALLPETPPERLYRPDVSITAWRKMCEHARGETLAEQTLAEQLQELQPVG